MTIAVTGATGFLGQTLIRALTAKGWPVRALIRRDPAAFGHLGDVEWIAGDLSDAAALEALTRDAEAVVHVAAAVRGRTFADFDRPNREGTEAVIRAVAATAAPGARFIHVSSLAARAGHLSHYAASKAAAEASVQTLARRIDWTVLRPPAIYGPGDTATLPFFRAVKRGLAPRIGGEERRFSLVHVDDVVAAIRYLLEAKTALGECVEIDDGRREGYVMADLYALIGEALGRRPVPVAVPAPLVMLCAHANTHLSRLTGRVPIFTPEKVRELTAPEWLCTGPYLDTLTDWHPAVPGHVGIPDTARWYLEKGWL